MHFWIVKMNRAEAYDLYSVCSQLLVLTVENRDALYFRFDLSCRETHGYFYFNLSFSVGNLVLCIVISSLWWKIWQQFISHNRKFNFVLFYHQREVLKLILGKMHLISEFQDTYFWYNKNWNGHNLFMYYQIYIFRFLIYLLCKETLI